jgi:hypothetical protein
VHRVIDAAWAVPDLALLERILTRLREWGVPAALPPLAQLRQTAPGHPVFGVSCRRASAAGPLIDITMPRSSDRSPVACPPPLFRRPVGPIERRP